MKKFLFSLLSLVLLTGCFNGSAVDNFELKIIPDENISIRVPVNFLELKDDNLPTGVIAGFADLSSVLSDFTPNISIAKSNLSNDISSFVFANTNIETASRTLSDYKEIQRESVIVAGEKTVFHQFEVKDSGEIRRFQQVYLTKENMGYVITASLPSLENKELAQTFTDVMMSFEFIIE